MKGHALITAAAVMIALAAMFPAVSAQTIGGDQAWFAIHCNVDGASVYFDGGYKGTISGGSLTVPVYTTGTPYSTVSVEKSGYYPASASLTPCPSAGQTRDIYVTLNPKPPSTGSLSISSTPSGASVCLSGSYRGTTPTTITGLDAGSYYIELDKDGYQPYRDTVTVVSGRTKSYHYPLQATRKPGYITITSTPSGAYIYMDGTYKGRTPTTITDISSGTHIFELDLNGYYDWKATRTISQGQNSPISATLSPIPSSPGSIHVTSTPTGAEVYLDGSYQGLTETAITGVSAGDHTLTLKKNGFQDYTTTVDVRSQTTSYVTATMQSGPTPPSPVGSIRVTTSPTGATILVDNVQKGISDLTVSDVPVGSHTVTAQMQGYQTSSTTVTVNQGETATVGLSLSPQPTPASPGFAGYIALAALVAGAIFLSLRRR